MLHDAAHDILGPRRAEPCRPRDQATYLQDIMRRLQRSAGGSRGLASLEVGAGFGDVSVLGGPPPGLHVEPASSACPTCVGRTGPARS